MSDDLVERIIKRIRDDGPTIQRNDHTEVGPWDEEALVKMIEAEARRKPSCTEGKADQTRAIRGVLAEWRKGCTNGPAGQCLECSNGALRAVEHLLSLPT